jgi:hypothetical protein
MPPRGRLCLGCVPIPNASRLREVKLPPSLISSKKRLRPSPEPSRLFQTQTPFLSLGLVNKRAVPALRFWPLADLFYSSQAVQGCKDFSDLVSNSSIINHVEPQRYHGCRRGAVRVPGL